MHPAKSVIFFTTASGTGYGLMVWLAMAALFDWTPIELPFGFVAFAVAFLLIVGGLLSSTFHLGHPERAWRAVTQWRSSWLSREGMAAIVAFAPMGLFALGWVFFGLPDWSKWMAAPSIAMALITVYTTSMIYGSLKSIPAWHSPYTSPGYLIFALAGGALMMAVLTAFWGYEISGTMALYAAVLIALAILIKLFYWRQLDEGAPVATAGSATGLGKFGKVRLIEGPHTEPNYLLNEMGFRVGRKHSAQLRRIAIIGFAVAAVVALIAGSALAGAAQAAALVLASVVGGVALVTERWLYFAEAKHVVTLYYGEQSA